MIEGLRVSIWGMMAESQTVSELFNEQLGEHSPRPDKWDFEEDGAGCIDCGDDDFDELELVEIAPLTSGPPRAGDPDEVYHLICPDCAHYRQCEAAEARWIESHYR